MVQEKKTPPIVIGANKMEKEEVKKGELTYVPRRNSGGVGGTNWQQVIISVIVSVLLILGFSSTTFSSKKDALTLLDNQKELETRVTAVDEKFSEQLPRIDNIINAMGEYAKKSDLTTQEADLSGLVKKDYLDSSLASVENKFTSFEERLTTLEEEDNGGGGGTSTTTDDETRWTVSVGFDKGLEDKHDTLKVTVRPRRVGPEEDIYDLEIEFYNSSSSTDNKSVIDANPWIWIRLTPQDNVKVGDDAFYLSTSGGSYGSWVDWDVDVYDRERGGVEIYRYVKFTSIDDFNLPDLGPGEDVEYDLELELFYQ